MFKILPILISFFIIGFSASSKAQDSRTFITPRINDVRLDYCKHWGRQCGGPAATLFCRQMGYQRAQKWTPDLNVGSRGQDTVVFGDGRICRSPTCSSFRSITCIKEKTLPQNTLKPARPLIPIPDNKPSGIARPKQPTILDKSPTHLNNNRRNPTSVRISRCSDPACSKVTRRPMTVNPESKFRQISFRWTVRNLRTTTKVMWQIADSPFARTKGNRLSPNNLILSGIQTGRSGLLKLNIDSIAERQSVGGTKLLRSVFYLRILPVNQSGNRTIGAPSNVLRIIYIRPKKKMQVVVNPGLFSAPLADGSLLYHCTSSCDIKLEHDFELNQNLLERYMYWDVTAIQNAEGILWQVSDGPFPPFQNGSQQDIAPSRLLTSGRGSGKNSGFVLRYKDLRSKLAAKNSGKPGRLRIPGKPNLYVRGLPISGANKLTLVGVPTKAIGIYLDIKPPAQKPIDIHIPTGPRGPDKLFELRIKSFEPPTFADANKWGCVKVKGYRGPVTPPIQSLFPIDGEICPRSYKGQGDGRITSFGEFIEWSADKVTGTWDWMADKFDKLKSVAVDIVLKYSVYGLQCRLGAMAANEIAGKDAEKKADDICKKGAELAVDSGLVYLGVPPTMPSYNELVDKGVNYAVEIAAEEFEAQTGVPCIEWCKDALRAGLSNFAEELKRQEAQPGCIGKEEAHKRGKEPLCIPDIVITEAASGAVYRPPLLTVQLTRKRTIPYPTRKDHPPCFVGAQMDVKNHFPGGRVSVSYGTNTKPRSKEFPPRDIQKRLFEADSVSVPIDIQPGMFIDVPVTFNKRTRFLLPWTRQLDIESRSQIALPNSYYRRDWFTVYWGGVAMLKAISSCAEQNDQINQTLPSK